MRKFILIALAVVVLLGVGVWFLGRDPAGSEAYSVVAQSDEGGARKCGLEYMETLAQDAAGNDLYFKVTSSTELLDGIYPVALFAVHGLRITDPDAQTGEYLQFVEAGLAAGAVDTRQGMHRPEGDVDAFVATSTEIDEMLTLPLDMLEGAELTVRLAGEAGERSFALPRVGWASGDELVECFKGMQARVNAAAAGTQPPAE